MPCWSNHRDVDRNLILLQQGEISFERIGVQDDNINGPKIGDG